MQDHTLVRLSELNCTDLDLSFDSELFWILVHVISKV